MVQRSTTEYRPMYEAATSAADRRGVRLVKWDGRGRQSGKLPARRAWGIEAVPTLLGMQ